MHVKKIVLSSLLALSLLLALGYWGYVQLNHNFSVSHIILDDWTPAKIIPANSPAEIGQAKIVLDQPFTYLGKGRQSFVFISQDGNYVLKFVKAHRVTASWFYKSVPLPGFLDKMRSAKLQQMQNELRKFFISMSLAKDPLQNMTGIVYLHSSPIHELQKQVTIIDRLGFAHIIDIDSVPFILQVKASKVWDILESLWEKKDTAALKCRLKQLVDLFVERAKCGIIDPDTRLLKNDNIGFVQDRAIYIDLGTFRKSPKSQSPEYLAQDFRVLTPIVEWLQQRDVDLAGYFQQQMQEAIPEPKN